MLRLAIFGLTVVAAGILPEPVRAAVIPVTSGLVLRYNDENLSTFAGEVTSWNNQGSYGALGNAAPNSPSLRPNVVVNGLNSHDVVDFSGVNGEYLLTGPFGTPVAQPATYFAVVRTDSFANYPTWWDGTSGGARHYFAVDTLGRFDLYAGTADRIGGSWSNSLWRIVRVEFNGASSNVDVDGTPNFTVPATPGPHSLGALSIGGSPIFGGALSFDGQMAELLVYDRLLNAAEEADVGGYLELVYGLDTAYPLFVPPPPVPEPSACILLGVAAVGLVWRGRRNR